MTRFRIVLALCMLVAVVSVPALAQSAKDAEVETLKTKVDALEKRMTSLEQNLSRQLRSLEAKLGNSAGTAPAAPGAPAADTGLESEAQAAYQEISKSMAFGEYEKAKGQMDEFMKKYGSTKAAQRADGLQRELAVIGKPTPANWDGIEKWFQGEKEIDLNNGKPTLVVFWELWCPHCKREVPKLDALYSSLKGNGLQVIGLTRLSRNTEESQVKEFLTAEKVGYPVAKENGTLASFFAVSGIPAAAVIKGGKVVWRGHPAKLSEAMLRAWL